MSAAFWDKIASKYAARPVDDPDAYAATLDRVRHYLKPEDNVLEVGCGTGSTAILLSPSVARYTATDISPKMLEIARAKPEVAALPQLSFAQADTIGAPDGTFDAVLGFSLLHLVPDLPATLSALHTRLRPDGLLITKTVCLSDLGLWLRAVIPVMRLVGKAPPVRFLSSKELEAEISAGGFEILETGGFPANRAAHFVVARKV